MYIKHFATLHVGCLSMPAGDLEYEAQEIMYPESGIVGCLKLTLYRGVSSQANRLHKDFASDPETMTYSEVL